MSLEREFAQLDAALRLPTVGHMTREQEIDELANLIAKYRATWRPTSPDLSCDAC